MKAINYLLAFIGGAAVGATAGLLFAPEKGTDLRNKITESLRKRGIRLSKVEMSDLVDEIAEQFEKDKQEGAIEG
ncbi:MAG: YtxH domain-containing protein [Bacteroidaceae bacterium]|nr:YtxH domain-containing protein [Bacteroidaceae bacterium]